MSARLIQRIESHWEEIATQVIEQVRRDDAIRHYSGLSESEIRERAHDLVVNLAYWQISLNDSGIAARYEQLGRRRNREGIPLHEVVYKLTLIRRQLATYVMEQNLNLSPLEIYEELELLRTLMRFFDLVIYSVVLGYEAEMNGRKGRTGEDGPSQLAGAT